MRFLETCPNCKYQEEINWRPSYMNIQKDVTRAFEAPGLADKLTPGVSISIGIWTYKLSKTREWIERMLTSVYEVEGWSRKYKAGHGGARRALVVKQNRNLSSRKQQTKLIIKGE